MLSVLNVDGSVNKTKENFDIIHKITTTGGLFLLAASTAARTGFRSAQYQLEISFSRTVFT
ncbi:hypothetical protein BACI349Y_540063 [Bacillus sp. 349Y]|nr:hypothetical protein BACI349Y_540063 [Bacillus sp. 349Y]